MPSAGPDHADDEDPGTRPRRRGKAPGADYVLHCVRTGPERGPSRVIPAQALLTSRSRRPCSALIRAATAATAASLQWSQSTATPWPRAADTASADSSTVPGRRVVRPAADDRAVA